MKFKIFSLVFVTAVAMGVAAGFGFGIQEPSYHHHIVKREGNGSVNLDGTGFAGQLCVLACNERRCDRLQKHIADSLQGEALIKRCDEVCLKAIINNEKGPKKPDLCVVA